MLDSRTAIESATQYPASRTPHPARALEDATRRARRSSAFAISCGQPCSVCDRQWTNHHRHCLRPGRNDRVPVGCHRPTGSNPPAFSRVARLAANTRPRRAPTSSPLRLANRSRDASSICSPGPFQLSSQSVVAAIAINPCASSTTNRAYDTTAASKNQWPASSAVPTVRDCICESATGTSPKKHASRRLRSSAIPAPVARRRTGTRAYRTGTKHNPRNRQTRQQ